MSMNDIDKYTFASVRARTETRMKAREILAVELGENPSGRKTIGGYLHELMVQCWHRGSSFDGKRPFGSSSWEFDLYAALGRAGMVSITFDESGYIDDFSVEERRKANELIDLAVAELGRDYE